MADETIMAEIAQRTKERARRVLDATMVNGETVYRGTLADALHELAASWREEAELLTRSKKKGWQSLSTELRQSATRVAGVAEDIKAIDSDPAPMPTTPDAEVIDNPPTIYTERCDYEHIPPQGRGPGDPIMRCVLDPGHDGNHDPQPVGKVRDDVRAYLADEPTGPTLHEEVKELTKHDPANDDPFATPSASYAPRPIALGPMWTFEDLMRPSTATAPEHWSWSQLNTIEDCGLKYRLQRIEQLPQVPEWAQLGGRVFHTCVEMMESLQSPSLDLAALWTAELHGEMAKVALATSLPPDKWRASNKGAEGYTWWREAGPDMLHRYSKWRAVFHDSNPGASRLIIAGLPVVEYGALIDIAGVEVKAVIDSAWSMPDGSILIEDFKSGRMTGDSAQLGLYAHALIHALTQAAQYRTERIFGTFFDARKGTSTEPIDLLIKHPMNEYVYRVHTAEATRRASLYRPRKSSFCGGCSVRYACPVGGIQ